MIYLHNAILHRQKYDIAGEATTPVAKAAQPARKNQSEEDQNQRIRACVGSFLEITLAPGRPTWRRRVAGCDDDVLDAAEYLLDIL